MVKVVPKFTNADIKKMILQNKQAIIDAILLNINRIGEEFVINARDNKTYKDQTGNLRSSIGYVVLYNGKQLNKNFEGTIDNIGLHHCRIQ